MWLCDRVVAPWLWLRLLLISALHDSGAHKRDANYTVKQFTCKVCWSIQIVMIPIQWE